VQAQRTRETNSGTLGNDQIDGKVFFPPGDRPSSRPVIKLQSLSSPEIKALTDQDGSFRFTHLRPDLYTVVVEAGDQYQRATETVAVGFSGPVPAQGDPGGYAIPFVYQVQIYLKPKLPNMTNGAAASSNAAFANVPASARELFQQALENVRAANHAKAIEQLRSVTAQAPKFGLAYNELAVEYLRTGRAAEGVETFKEALRITPDDPTLQLNYGIALLNLKDFAAAETELRLATQNPNMNSSAVHYYLGVSLMNLQKFDGARSELETAIKNGGDRIALAHKYLGGLYWRNNQYREGCG
jgi:Flp pilus assembly protein TadD